MKLVKIGKVLKAHGYKGSFTVAIPEGKTSAIGQAPTLFIGKDEQNARPYTIVEAAWMPKAWKLTVQELTSDAMIAPLKEFSVFISRDALPQPKSGEYYLSDLKGCEGIDTSNGHSIGTFTDLEEITNGAGKVVQQTWIFESSTTTLKVPAVSHFLERVDTEERKIFLKNINELVTE